MMDVKDEGGPREDGLDMVAGMILRIHHMILPFNLYQTSVSPRSNPMPWHRVPQSRMASTTLSLPQVRYMQTASSS